ncbi:MAG: ABC transporter permease [Myxococcales bacterium]|nr:MAG: ABC transporter permease [Myxococcales bacterium]
MGGPIGRSLEELGRFGLLAAETFAWLFRPPFRRRLLLQQLEFVGNRSLSIILLTGLFTGAVFALQSIFAFRLFNAESMVGSTVALSLTRELAPVLTSLMVTGRCGSAMAAEIGTMRVTEQIDALASMAVNPVQYLFAPRVLASLIMVPILTMVFNVVGTAGAYVVAVYFEGVDPGILLDNVRWFVDPADVYIGFAKAAVFALILSLVGCYKGYTTQGGARGVGLATTQAVVISSVTILVTDYFLTQFINTFFEQNTWIR